MKKLILGFLLAMVALFVATGILYLRPGYRAYQEARSLNQARSFMLAQDWANASLSARRVLQINPRNSDACRIMANLAELGRSPSTIDWRRRLAQLSPGVPNQLELAACALRLERPPYPVAAQTLQEIALKAADMPGFHVLSAELALKMNRIAQATEHFRVAATLQADNPLHRLNLAALELQSTDNATAQASRATLDQFSEDRRLGAVALRWLIADHLRRRNLTEAEPLSRRLISRSDASLDDQLQHLAILQRWWGMLPTITAVRQEFAERLCSLKASATTNKVALFSICEWMGRHGLADDALSWLSALDAHVRAAQPVPLAMANLHLARGDWPTLQTFLDGQQWADLDFLRLALSARAAWGQNQSLLGDTRWTASLNAARNHLGSLMLLLGLAADWGRDREDILWQIHRRFPKEQWALRELESVYNVTRNTRGLNQVYAKLVTDQTGAMEVTNCNNYACTSMLLGAHLPEAHQLARDLHNQHPDDVIVASTYAYSLHLQGRTRDGLEVLDRFNADALQQPSVALYYGVLLGAVGDVDGARNYLALALKARLLPEEKKLLTMAENLAR
jgi:Tfp pilus assembly protein PilF